VIVGVGLDLVEIRRVRRILDRQGDAFADRILCDDEGRERLANHDGPAHLAGLFAAKEAVMKAMGTGMAGASFREIRIRHRDSGQPTVELRGQTLQRATAMGIDSWQVSISHSRTTAAAVAIALR
jgi:holo-[acyl-carrier protein] synthase